MKAVICIPTCHTLDYGQLEHLNGHTPGPNTRIQAIRDTWLPLSDTDVRFFYGRGSDRPPLADEVYLPVPDDYAGLPQKVIAICKWALSSGYDYLLKIDDDSYVWPDRVLAELKAGFDYAGWCHGNMCIGGPGYWLSRKAMQAVIDFKGEVDWREDAHIGNCMEAAQIKPVYLSSHAPSSRSKFSGWMSTLNGVTPEDMWLLQAALPVKRVGLDITSDDVDGEIYPYAKRYLESGQFPKFYDLMEKFLNEEHQPTADDLADRLGELLPDLFDYFPHIYEDKAHGGLRDRRSEAMLEWQNRS